MTENDICQYIKYEGNKIAYVSSFGLAKAQLMCFSRKPFYVPQLGEGPENAS